MSRVGLIIRTVFIKVRAIDVQEINVATCDEQYTNNSLY